MLSCIWNQNNGTGMTNARIKNRMRCYLACIEVFNLSAKHRLALCAPLCAPVMFFMTGSSRLYPIANYNFVMIPNYTIYWPICVVMLYLDHYWIYVNAIFMWCEIILKFRENSVPLQKKRFEGFTLNGLVRFSNISFRNNWLNVFTAK